MAQNLSTITNGLSIYPFGMLMSERSYSSPAYRYGFNGQEKDDEVSGEGNTNTAQFWEYDCRLGRRWNLDPKPMHSQSEYAVFGNNPIWHNDPDGDTIHVTGSKSDKRAFIRQINRASGNKFKIDAHGNLALKSKTYNTATTRRKSGELSKLLETANNSTDVIPIGAVRNDNSTLYDSYARATYDVADFRRIGSRAVRAGLIAHVLSERLSTPGYDNPNNRTDPPFTPSHNQALVVESRIVTDMLHIPNVTRINTATLYTNKDGTKYIDITFEYGTTKFNVRVGVDNNNDPTGKVYTKLKKN